MTCLLGCRDKTTVPESPQQPQPRAAVELRVLVLGDVSLADGIKLLRGEWAERSGGSLTVVNVSDTSKLDTGELTADLLIYPPLLLGELVDRKTIRPVRERSLDAKETNLTGLFPLVRDEEMRFDGETYGISIGCQTLLLGLPQALQPEYFHTLRLIASAAAYTDPNSRLTLLFEPKEMKPRLQSAPFQRALKELLAAEAKTAGKAEPTDAPVTEPPPAVETYSAALDRWQPQNEQSGRVTLLSIGGRLASVSAATRNSTSAFQLLQWLASSEIATQLGGKSTATFPCRNSQIPSAAKWFPSSVPKSQAEQAARLTQQAMSREHFTQLPRIPGIRRYLQLLDASIAMAISNKLAPDAALQDAAEAWEKLTDELGREEQAEALKRHLQSP